MKKNILYGLWIFFYILCLVLGYTVTNQPTTAQQVGLTVLSLCFFLPPAILLIDAYQQQDKKSFLLLRTVSGISLGLTSLVLLLNVLSTQWSEAVGDFLYQLLILVSVPMSTTGNWLISQFLWGCLLFATFPPRKKAAH